ncbi:conjugative transposon protein TraM [Niabella sp.]|uniref:conjugative transposon protein TraM n=1 Tax=Niabella sp. TaxID=1962976 RepID=UPI00260F68E8|nr:conjugative transposon protein TraM [Niabella sp.]
MQDTLLVNERKRKFWLILPVLSIPFVIFLFYSFGGGKGNGDQQKSPTSALSTMLPDPLLNDQQKMDKLSLYERAKRDSEQAESNAPFGAWKPVDSSRFSNTNKNDGFGYSPEIPLYPSTPPLNEQLQKSRESQMEQKIMQLQQKLQSPDEAAMNSGQTVLEAPGGSSPEIARLETMMQSLSQPSDTNPELVQASSLIDKILDVQHPERVNQRLKKQSLENKKDVFPVSAVAEKEVTDLFADEGQNKSTSSSGFYDEDPVLSEDQNALRAVVHESQTLTSGATVKIRLEQDAYIQGVLIPKGSFVFGICTLNGERLEVAINSIRKENSIYPVSLIAYDLDGLPGIRIPGSINRDASKENSERAIQSIGLGSLDPSLGAQAASAGIEAAKNLLSRKVKLIKVVVKAGYPLLIAPDKNNS